MLLFLQMSSSPVSLAYQAADGLPHARLVELDVLLKLPGRHLEIGGIRSMSIWHSKVLLGEVLTTEQDAKNFFHLELAYCLLHLSHKLEKRLF